MRALVLSSLIFACALAACSEDEPTDVGLVPPDSGLAGDSGLRDLGFPDLGFPDSGVGVDANLTGDQGVNEDATPTDASPEDGAVSEDAAPMDAAPMDVGPTDTGTTTFDGGTASDGGSNDGGTTCTVDGVYTVNIVAFMAWFGFDLTAGTWAVAQSLADLTTNPLGGGTYSYANGQLTIEDAPGKSGCQPGEVGVYSVAFSPNCDSFTLTMISDACMGRGESLDGATFNR